MVIKSYLLLPTIFGLIFFKVPYEILNKRFRNAQKLIDKEVTHISTQMNEIVSSTSNESTTVEEASNSLGDVVKKLEDLKRKARLSCSYIGNSGVAPMYATLAAQA